MNWTARDVVSQARISLLKHSADYADLARAVAGYIEDGQWVQAATALHRLEDYAEQQREAMYRYEAVFKAMIREQAQTQVVDDGD